MSPWHVDDSALQAYAAQELSTLERASVEAHVMRCDTCRGGLARLASASVGTVSFDALFERVQTRIEHRHPAPRRGSDGWG
jgi:anti-sigma factor RsiW